MPKSAQQPGSEPNPHSGRRKILRAALLGALLLGVALRIAAVFTANVSWDEFALLHTADLTLERGSLETDGRPGLATLMLLPFVRDCHDEIEVVRRARLLWTALTLLLLAGVACWAAELRPRSARRWGDAALAVALLAAVPAFLDSSLQLRTDQLALAGGAWGGALLLASRRRPALALLAGVAFGVGLLGSQKLAYLAALAGLLCAGQHFAEGDLRPRREALRAALTASGVALVWLVFRLATDAAFEIPAASPARKPLDAAGLSRGLSIFEFYRNTIGWSEYRAIAPTLLPHALLLTGLALASVRALRRHDDDVRWLAVCWSVLALGLGVGLFHAGAFRYFWMTLGLFPALALALARGPVLALLPGPAPLRGLLVVGFWGLLLLPGALHLGLLLDDAQAVQRESLAFVHRNFDRRAAGFHPESALVCQTGEQPLPTYFSQHIHARFGTSEPRREKHSRLVLDAFREEPVLFILQSFRLNQFPGELRRFWAENYQPYRASVFVAGRRLAGSRGEEQHFELLVPGRYRWLPRGEPTPLAIGEERVEPGAAIALAAGATTARFVDDAEGLLVLALDEPPGPAPLRFYQ